MGVHKFSRVFLVLCFLSIAHSFDLCHGFQALCSLALVPTRPNFLGNEILTLHQFNATLNQILIKGECAWKQHFQFFFFTFSEFIKFLDKLKHILIHMQMDEESLHPKIKYAPRALRLLFQETAFHYLLRRGSIMLVC